MSRQTLPVHTNTTVELWISIENGRDFRYPNRPAVTERIVHDGKVDPERHAYDMPEWVESFCYFWLTTHTDRRGRTVTGEIVVFNEIPQKYDIDGKEIARQKVRFLVDSMS